MKEHVFASEAKVIPSPASVIPITLSGADRAVLAHRIVQAGIVVTLMWKWPFFLFANRMYELLPLDDPFFPNWLRSIFVLRVAFLTAVATAALSILTSRQAVRRSCSWLTLAVATVLCLHQGSYNDMTFVTSWWTSLWAAWYVSRLDQDEPEVLLRKGAFLSRLILSVILLGGGLGKWTSEYWSGEVFYEIYFRDRDFWVFNLLRSHFDAEFLRVISMWYSRWVVLTETIAGFGLWLLPPEWAAGFAVLVLTSIAVLSNWLLFSVLTCLIGLASVGFLVPRKS